MGETSVTEPELLIKALRVDNKSVTFPPTEGVSVIQRIVRVAANVALLGPSIGIDKVPIMIATTIHDEDPVEAFVFHELNSEGHLELPHRTRGITLQIHRIGLQKLALTVNVKVSGPGLKRGDLGGVVDVLECPL